MYLRRNILVVEGEEERPGENTNVIALKLFRALGLRVNFRDICRSHRNGPKNRRGNRPRPIYIKLVSHDLKDEVMKRRNRLRFMPSYKNVYIDENLTQDRRWLFNRVREEVGNKRCHTYDGTIFVKFECPNGKRTFKINNSKDFFYVFNKYPGAKVTPANATP